MGIFRKVSGKIKNIKRKVFHKLLVLLKPLLINIFEIEALVLKYLAAKAYKKLFWATWNISENPEFFDHHIDLFYLWQKTKNSLWLERGVFGNLAIKRGGKVMELACGDGFNSRNFYSHLAESVLSVDFDKNAIKTAKKKNSAKNVEYILADIRTNMPNGDFDNIVWDAAIEHFTKNEIKKIMKNIKVMLEQKKGILSGYTMVEREKRKGLQQHEYEFKNMADLKRFLTPHFKNVIVFETIFPERHNLYFWASDGTIPFSDGWKYWSK
ncbi:MAG: class I SAM-dependent methyltransferase [Leptospirales bacterium]|nr:class I SAM-dependent methyltransferase [Leptospirales bacterium]